MKNLKYWSLWYLSFLVLEVLIIEDKNSDASTSSNMQIYDRSTKLWNIFVDAFIFLFDEATCFLFYQKCIYTIYMYINSLWQFKMFPCLFTCKTLLLVHVPPCTHRFEFQKVVFDSSTHWTILWVVNYGHQKYTYLEYLYT